MASFFSAKKILLIGFIFVLLLAIPLTVYLLQKQQETKSNAAAATTLYFSSNPTYPTQNVTVGQKFGLDIFLNPNSGNGNNQVSFAKLTISYDASMLSIDTADGGLIQNTSNNSLSNVLDGPTYTASTGSSPATASITLSIGANPTAAITTTTKIASIYFIANASTNQAGTQIQFVSGNQTQILSVGSTDMTNENVLSSATPATIVISASSNNITPTVTVNPSITPTVTVTPTITPTPTLITVNPTSVGQTLFCNGLSLSQSSTGTAPYSLSLTALGTSNNGTISNVTFNFGDGQTQEVTQGGGIGSSSIQVLVTHTYANSGTFNANAVITDNNGNATNPSSCTDTITVNSPQVAIGTTTTVNATTVAPTSTTVTATPTSAQVITAAPQPITTLPKAGPAENIIVGGLTGILLTVVGAVLLFSL